MPIDALSLVVCTMMGLALGVDYSLLIVSRFREELAAGKPPHRAAAATRRSAGRTTAIAGATLFFSIFLSAFFQPGSLLVSLAAALAVVTAIAVLIAWVSLPALLTLLGPRINAGQIGRSRPGSSRSRVAAAASAALRRPAFATAAIVVPLLLLSAPALAFDTGSPASMSSQPPARRGRTPKRSPTRSGPGWQAPFILTLAAEEGPLTSRPRLALLAATQRRVARLVRRRGRDRPRGRSLAAARPLRSLGAELQPGGSSRGRPAHPPRSPIAPSLRAPSPRSAAASAKPRRPAACSAKARPAPARAPNCSPAASTQAGAGGERASGALERLASGTERARRGPARRLLERLRPLARARHPAAQPTRPRASAAPATSPPACRAPPPPIPRWRPPPTKREVLASVLSANREELARLRAPGRDPEHRPRQALLRRQTPTGRLRPPRHRIPGPRQRPAGAGLGGGKPRRRPRRTARRGRSPQRRPRRRLDPRLPAAAGTEPSRQPASPGLRTRSRAACTARRTLTAPLRLRLPRGCRDSTAPTRCGARSPPR